MQDLLLGRKRVCDARCDVRHAIASALCISMREIERVQYFGMCHCKILFNI